MYRDTLAILVTILVIYWKSTMSSASFLSASTTKLRDFLSLDLAAGLEKYIQHENKRLEIIKSAKGYEDEVPLVLVRLEKLGRLSHILASSQAERVKLQQQSLSVPHPTTTLRLVRDFLDTWSDKLRNETLYGFRLREFLTNDKSELPSDSDLDEVARALAEIQYVYNMTTSDLYAGKVMGLQGSPLKPRDAYDVGRVSMKMGHLKQAATWFERAMSEIPATERASGNSSFPVAETLASLGIILFNMDEKGKGLQLLEEAADLDAESEDIVKMYLSHRFGRDVQPLVETDPGDDRRHWFRLCANASSGHVAMSSPMKWYHVCRYKRSSLVPYRVYREEILSRSPYVSLLYQFINGTEADQIVNASVSNLTHGAVKGAEGLLHFVEGASLGSSVEIAGRIADRISDLTGLYTGPTGKEGSSWTGDPMHVLNYGLAGTFLPHVDGTYDPPIVMRNSGYRMASVLIYLSDVNAGGATTFTSLNVTVTPSKGNALLWYNLRPSGEMEAAITHAGCPVAVGAKWVAVKGLWSKGNELRRPCGLKRTASHLAVDKMLITRPKTRPHT